MRRRKPSGPKRVEIRDPSAALAGLSAQALCEVVQEVLLELDGRARARVVGSLIARAAKNGGGFLPPAVGEGQVSEVLAFAQAAQLAHEADPSLADGYLHLGSGAFLRKNYAAARRIFGALLPPISQGDIYLGQHEMVDEVLGADVGDCAAMYVVSVYTLTAAEERSDAVWAAFELMRGARHFFDPLKQLERVAVEPLPDLPGFLPQWRALLLSKSAARRSDDWDPFEGRWLREVVERLEGVPGLAQMARRTRRAEDLRFWCQSLVQSKNWPAAFQAYNEAAELVTDKDYMRGEFLDGAALAAQILEREDLPMYLERAWCASPSLERLLRWLGSADTKATLSMRVGEALAGCPREATRQRALLQVLSGDYAAAAQLLVSASGLGWSQSEHPGHLLFPLFTRLLTSKDQPARRDPERLFRASTDRRKRRASAGEPGEPSLATPQVTTLLTLAGISIMSTRPSGAALLAAMKQAAETRVQSVTEQKVRSKYGHAAELVATCVECDRTGEATAWAAALKTEYNRSPALRSELEDVLKKS
jgi:hypothetical protein